MLILGERPIYLRDPVDMRRQRRSGKIRALPGAD